jgi:glycosyltransferase involved in cell wall biosynthesis
VKAKGVVTYEGFEKELSENLPVDMAVIRTRLEEMGIREKYFLYVGNAYPHNNIENLIEGFQLLLKKEKNITLVLVGRKDFFYQRLIGRVKKETLSHVKFIFNATDEDLQKLYREAVALVSASKMEGFGLVPLEAMSQGCIPIVSNIPSFQEVCQDAALYFDPDSEATIAEKMHYVLSMDESTRKEFLSRGKNRILHFSWKDTALMTLKVYEDCDRLRPSK